MVHWLGLGVGWSLKLLYDTTEQDLNAVLFVKQLLSYYGPTVMLNMFLSCKKPIK